MCVLAATRYGFLRKVVELPPSTSAAVATAVAFISAPSADETLCAFKFYVNGQLVSVGPGRPEAPVRGGDGTWHTNPFVGVWMCTWVTRVLANHAKLPKVVSNAS